MEIWKDIKGYEGLYQISNLGKIKSNKKILKPYINKKDGYAYIGLHKNKNNKVLKIHRLVAQTFIDNPNNLPQVNHKDENKTNNSIDNLEWCSAKYNITYSQGKMINQFDKNNIFLKQWPSAMEIQRHLKIDNSNIIACCRNKRQTAGGYIWKYNN